jgi:hypothetical protein
VRSVHRGQVEGLMDQGIISAASVLIAIAAVSVAIWQARANARAAEKSNALHIVSQIFGEWRSISFHKHRSLILYETIPMPMATAFESLPPEFRESAYIVCYFCDYVGMLRSFKIIKEDLIIGVMGTQLMQIWKAMEPYILEERKHRKETLPPDTPRGFLPYYEDLVKRIVQLGGSQSTINIQVRLGMPVVIDIPAVTYPIEALSRTHKDPWTASD